MDPAFRGRATEKRVFVCTVREEPGLGRGGVVDVQRAVDVEVAGEEEVVEEVEEGGKDVMGGMGERG